MQELFPLLAQYNERTNKEMMTVLESCSPAQISNDQGVYYGSIIGILNHIFIADIIWLRRFAKQLPELSFMQSILAPIDFSNAGETLHGDLATLNTERIDLDQLIMRFSNVSGVDFHQILEYHNSRGSLQKKILWRAILHMFNHQTHHRGEISAVLDQLQIANDFSNLIWKF